LEGKKKKKKEKRKGGKIAAVEMPILKGNNKKKT